VVTSLEHQVHVTSKDPNVAGEIVLAPGEQLEVPSGKQPGTLREIDPEVFRKSSPCLDDGDFRLSAVTKDRREFEFAMIGAIPAMNIPTDGHQPVASGPVSALGATPDGGIGAATCIPSTGCKANDPVAGRSTGVSGPSPPVGPPTLP
jgi:hypothetical protein